jgi:hypothetical protein
MTVDEFHAKMKEFDRLRAIMEGPIKTREDLGKAIEAAKELQTTVNAGRKRREDTITSGWQ